MRLTAVVQPPAEYAIWAEGQTRAAAAPSTALEKQGQQVFMSQACGACHSIAGTPADGTAAPNLTHVGSRETLAAGRLPNTPQNLAAFLHDPQTFKPGSQMANFHLSDQQLQALTAYLESLR